MKFAAGKRVLLRVDLNVPLRRVGRSWKVVDDSRLREAAITITRLMRARARVIVLAHLGEPKGTIVPSLRLAPVTQELAKLLPRSAHLQQLTTWERRAVMRACAKVQPGHVLCLENLRFQKGEEKNNPVFATQLAALGDVYMNDAFSVSHRAHASIDALHKLLPAYAGWQLEQEVAALNNVLKHPKRPLILISGGAKVHDKIDLMLALAPHASAILVGGVVGNALLKAAGYAVGKSKIDPSPRGKELRQLLKSQKTIAGLGKFPLVQLPHDVVVATTPKGEVRVVDLAAGERMKPSEQIFDIGPETIRHFAAVIRVAQTIIWNGPMGLLEEPTFRFGTKALAQLIGARSKGRAYSVVGGGDSLQALDDLKMGEYIDHRSTAGGAMLAYLAGKHLPGLDGLARP